jgi:uncharacterized protein YjbJ (UPF0337 family)
MGVGVQARARRRDRVLTGAVPRRLAIFGNKAEELKGKTNETVGQATADRDLEAEGQADQTKGNLKQAGEKVKDVFKS